MDVLVPFAAERPKTRLADTLSLADRRAFAAAMLTDVLAAVDGADCTPELLTTEPVELTALPTEAVAWGDPSEWTVSQTVDERPLEDAVNAVLADREPDHEEPLGVVMADLALASPAAVRRLVEPRPTRPPPSRADEAATESSEESAQTADIVIAPGLGGGTNAVVVRHPAFRVDYHGASVRDHRQIASELDATVREVDSRRLATDIDRRSDLAEVLLHGEGAARDWLVDAGFRLVTGNGRVGVERVE
ncbi:MAG: 2-phospho-L-lactate guanylyltransferase [Halobaculum sp.]